MTENRMKKLDLMVVGPGLIGKKHIDLINACNEAKLGSIVAPDHSHNQDVARAHGVPLYMSLADCLAVGHPDGVIISSPNEFHFDQASICITAGIPVLIEKPVTVRVEEAELLLDLAQRHDAKVLVGHHRTYSPLLKTARDVIESGRLGQLVSVNGSAQFYKPDQYFKDGPWRTQLGGGPILINMIHEVGNLRALAGEIVAVQAIASSSLRGFAVEDTVAINFIFASGVLGTFLLSDTAATPVSWEQTSRENPSYPTYPDVDCYVISGTRGTLFFPTMRIKYYSDDITPSWWNPFKEDILPTSRSDPLKEQLDHFIRVIRNEEKPLVSIRDGFRNLLITEAIQESIKTRSIVQI